MGGNQNHHRRSIRLPGADYSVPGFYFVTMCVKNREHLFGEVVNREMRLNEYGNIIKNMWDTLPEYFVNSITDEFQIMPNHVHGIIGIVDRRGGVSPPQIAGGNTTVEPIAGHNTTVDPIIDDNTVDPTAWDNTGHTVDRGGETPPLPAVRTNPTLGQIVAYFKYQTTKIINQQIYGAVGIKIWQRNYYEHIVRTPKSLERIRQYIRDNPWNWTTDLENPEYAIRFSPTDFEKQMVKHYKELLDNN